VRSPGFEPGFSALLARSRSLDSVARANMEG
jgi:hypothetical protein